MQIAKKDVVVGDIVILNTGEEVPADGELLEAVMLNIDESTLTGEPICHKTTDPCLVGTDNGGGAHGLACVHLADEVVGLEHAAHRVCQ